MEVLKPLPFALKGFQLDTVPRVALSRMVVFGADTGTGKSVMTICALGMLFEDGLLDHLVLEAEPSKLIEWEADLKRFTSLSVARYDRPPERRAKLRQDLPQVLLGTYETFRADLAPKDPSKRSKPSWNSKGRSSPTTAKVVPGPLLEALRGRRTIMVLDEGTSKMGATRTSWTYQAHLLTRRELSKDGLRMWVLSATPMSRDPVGYFNVARLLDPVLAGTIESFEHEHVRSRDEFGAPKDFKNLDRSDDPGVVPLVKKLEGLVIYRSKGEPEIAQWFPLKVADPPKTPGYTFVDPTELEEEFWSAVQTTYANQADEDTLSGLMRQLIGHPLALTLSQGAMAADIVRLVGAEGLKRLPTSKLDALVTKLRSIGSAQAVVFTFFGQSVLPLAAQRLAHEGISCVVNHGQLSPTQRELARKRFNAGEVQVYLSSDAGARGVNLPAGQWVIDYDVAPTAEVGRQRRDRIDRIDSPHKVIYFTSLVMRGTVEMGLARLSARRQEWAERLGSFDGSGLSAATRKAVLSANRTVRTL